MRVIRILALLVMAAALFGIAKPAEAQIWFDGNIYMKFLWGTDRLGTAIYNFTAIPGEGLGDSGQGTQLELFLNGKVGKKVQFKASIQSRFNRNFWTNFGGFYGADCNGAILPGGNPNCLGSEFDPRANQYVKLRNAVVTLNPGYSWLDNAVIGENDLGQYDPFVIGRIRYIDRFNASAIQVSGSANKRQFTWDLVRISLPTYLGNNFTTGDFQPQDGTWGFQPKFRINSKFDVNGLVAYSKDIEVDPTDFINDDGRDIKSRSTNAVGGFRVGVHPNTKIDINGSAYFSNYKTDLNLNGDNSDEVFGFAQSAFAAAPLGDLSDGSYKLNVDLNDPLGKGLSFNFEYFNIGENYVSIWAARRESDVLLTEGFDSAFIQPGPSNSAFGVFSGSGDAPQPGPPTRTNIGYGGWSSYTVQVPTLNADNQFTDFDEPVAETVIGWKGFTAHPTYTAGNWDVAGEYTYLGYNTNWQAWNDPSRPITVSPYPMQEGDTGVGHNYRNAYSPFRDRKTQFLVGKAKYSFNGGLQVWGKYKRIDETDNRMNDAAFLPYLPGDCPGGGIACANSQRFYSPGNSTASFYGNPPVITVNGVTGYQWKPFDSLGDDDRDLNYNLIQFGAGKQLTGDFNGSVVYEHYSVDLADGNTAFQAYQLHEMASGKHRKSKLMLIGHYLLPGLPEAGFQYEYNWGTYEPDFGGGFVTNFADAATAQNYHVPVGSPGFFGRFGGWNSLAKHDYRQQRLKAYLKVVF